MRMTASYEYLLLAVLSSLLISELTTVTAFSSSPAFLSNRGGASAATIPSTGTSMMIMKMAVSESGIETGVIKGIREDSEEIDFGRCGVKLAEETAVRMSGQVISNSYNANAAASAEWKQIDNIIKLTPVDLESVAGGVKIVATASAVEEYKDPGQGIVKEVLYAPDECAKAILKRELDLAENTGGARIVINVAGGNDLQVSEVLDAVVKVSAGFNRNLEIVWNSLSYKEFTDGEASMVVVSLEKIDDGQDLTVSGVASGEIYMHNGKYMTVDESDIITDFSEY
ncbi:hypothetical protein MHU86_1863 [Fragilaria crotonensis]|nr:hypothetical protein MHU86_1863 [Fragilaria crotonensis]